MSATTATTVTDWLLDHAQMTKDTIDPDLPALRGKQDGSEADIEEIVRHKTKNDRFVLKMTDGTKFLITVEPTL